MTPLLHIHYNNIIERINRVFPETCNSQYGCHRFALRTFGVARRWRCKPFRAKQSFSVIEETASSQKTLLAVTHLELLSHDKYYPTKLYTYELDFGRICSLAPLGVLREDFRSLSLKTRLMPK